MPWELALSVRVIMHIIMHTRVPGWRILAQVHRLPPVPCWLAYLPQPAVLPCAPGAPVRVKGRMPLWHGMMCTACVHACRCRRFWAYCLGRSYDVELLPTGASARVALLATARGRTSSGSGLLPTDAQRAAALAGGMEQHARLPKCFRDIRPKLTIQVRA